MRFSAEEKTEIVLLVSRSPEGVNKSLHSLGIHKRTFYNWYHAYCKDGIDGLAPKSRSKRQWNYIPDDQRELVVEMALEYPDRSSRELAVKMVDETGMYISESSVYRILKERGLIQPAYHSFMIAGDEFHTKTKFVNEMWQTDFTYFNIKGGGWYHLSTILDDYSRYIIHCELCKGMKAEDVMRTVDAAMIKAKIRSKAPPKILSDNGSCYISKDLNSFLTDKYGIDQIHGKPGHPQTQGKIERYHRSLKSVVNLHHYYSPDQLTEAIREYVDYYNKERYHESLNNLTPQDVYLGRGELILKERQRIKEQSLKNRKTAYHTSKLLTQNTPN